MVSDTQAVHGGRGAEAYSSDPGCVPHVPAIDLSTTYGFDHAAGVVASMDRLLSGAPDAANSVYARLHNPTVAGFEEALSGLEGAEGTVAFATGMAAITALVQAALLAASENGRPEARHVVAVRPLYGGTDHLLESGLLGTTVTWADATAVGAAVRDDTVLVFAETPANPTLALTDVSALVRDVRSAAQGRVPVAIDSTFATPVLQNPLALGADMVVHSATKFLGGHGDAMGGAVCGSETWASTLRRVRMITGGTLHPLSGYLLHRGLQTLPIRVRAQQESAKELAARLDAHPEVLRVYFPGLSGCPRERRLLETQQRGPGSVLAFCLRVPGSSVPMMDGLRLITRAVSLGSVDSLIQAPALLTHRVVDQAGRDDAGISDDLLRLSVGLESVDDLWKDLERSVSAACLCAA